MSTDKHRRDAPWFSQHLHHPCSPFTTAAETQTNKGQITQPDQELLLQSITPPYYIVLLHLQSHPAPDLLILRLGPIPLLLGCWLAPSSGCHLIKYLHFPPLSFSYCVLLHSSSHTHTDTHTHAPWAIFIEGPLLMSSIAQPRVAKGRGHSAKAVALSP